MPATVTLRAFPDEPHEGKVSFIYPEMMKTETRTVTVRIELPNPDGKMKTGMYADVVFRVPATARPRRLPSLTAPSSTAGRARSFSSPRARDGSSRVK